MLRRWTILAVPALLAATLSAAAADSDTPKTQNDSQKIDKILDQLKELKATVDELEKVRADIKSLDTKIELRCQTIQERIDRVNDRIDGLNTRIKRLEGDLEAMRTQATTSNRPSGYSGLGNGSGTPAAPPPLPPASGTIRLRNTFPDQVSVVVDGVSYQLMPYDTRDIAGHPAGTFTYEVLGIQPRKTVALGPNETFTITVYPR
jgi:outer membrane murein-binding lipoprotein Lpp